MKEVFCGVGTPDAGGMQGISDAAVIVGDVSRPIGEISEVGVH